MLRFRIADPKVRATAVTLARVAACLLLTWASALHAQTPRPRARDLGVPFVGAPGPLNAITDVAGVTVGHATLISGDGPLKVGEGPVRTGVTVVLPRGADSNTRPTFAGWFSMNGNGEMTGTTWVEESGFLEGPVAITNTHSVGVVRDALIAWRARSAPDSSGYWWSLPVVAETYDGFLNDINGFHVKERHVFEALASASGGRVAEGNVGGGTGMVCYGFKGGIGTASRRLTTQEGGYTVGVLVQANFGRRAQLMVAGAPVGTDIAEGVPYALDQLHAARGELGSIIIVVATDAPLLPHQLKRLARRASLGMARTGGMSGNGSGDIFIAFSTANPDAFTGEGLATVQMMSNEDMNPVFDATIYATEEAIINAMTAADTMVGADNHRVVALPHERLREVLRKYGRLAP
ncbi:MAG: aminopeptidase [Acidobacteria bacterium]|nr:aminopeptidase [Acidobacteriota bacterium]